MNNLNRKLPRRIYIDSDMWMRNIIINDIEGMQIGKMKFRFLSLNLDAELFDKKYFFEAKGIFQRQIDIYDDCDHFLANIKFKWNSKLARMKLIDGREYEWRKTSFFGDNWEMIRDYPDSIYDPILLTFTRKSMWQIDGRINNEEIMGDEESIVTLAFIYIGFYLKIRQKQRS
jgi:hypothetical protein